MIHKSQKCPECGSFQHFLCAAGEHVQMVVRAPANRHLVDELVDGDLLVIFRKRPYSFEIGPRVKQKRLDPFLSDFAASLGATLVLPPETTAGVKAEVLLVGCGQVEQPGDDYGAEGVTPAGRAACLAFDDALSEAARVDAKRVLLDVSHILENAGPALAAALHCRLTLAEANGVLPALKEVVIFARGKSAGRLASTARSEGPICPHCPFAKQCNSASTL